MHKVQLIAPHWMGKQLICSGFDLIRPDSTGYPNVRSRPFPPVDNSSNLLELPGSIPWKNTQKALPKQLVYDLALVCESKGY